MKSITEITKKQYEVKFSATLESVLLIFLRQININKPPNEAHKATLPWSFLCKRAKWTALTVNKIHSVLLGRRDYLSCKHHSGWNGFLWIKFKGKRKKKFSLSINIYYIVSWTRGPFNCELSRMVLFCLSSSYTLL